MSERLVTLELADDLRKQAEISNAKAMAGQYAGLVNDGAAVGLGGMAEALNAIQNGRFREEWCDAVLGSVQNLVPLSLVDSMLDLNSAPSLKDLTSQKAAVVSIVPDPQMKKSSVSVKNLFKPPAMSS